MIFEEEDILNYQIPHSRTMSITIIFQNVKSDILRQLKMEQNLATQEKQRCDKVLDKRKSK